MSKIKLLVCGNVKNPTRKNGDAGIDLYVPEFSHEFVTQICEENDFYDFAYNKKGTRRNVFSLEYGKIVLQPGEDIKIPTMVRALIPEDECLRFSNKSGVALKQKLIVGAEIIDSSYEGIMNIHVFNVSNKPTIIEFGQKLVQAVPIKINTEQIEILKESDELTVEDFYKKHDHTRGDGGFGSTGLK